MPAMLILNLTFGGMRKPAYAPPSSILFGNASYALYWYSGFAIKGTAFELV
jgi:hypothetical protein